MSTRHIARRLSERDLRNLRTIRKKLSGNRARAYEFRHVERLCAFLLVEAEFLQELRRKA